MLQTGLKQALISYKYYIIIIVILISGCASPPLELVDLKGFSVIQKGETAKLKWHFNYADEVTIDKIQGVFNGLDSAYVSPSEDTQYIITVHQDDETMRYSWRVFVNPKDTGSPRRGPQTLTPLDLNQSYKPSEFLSGKIDKGSDYALRQIKLMRIIHPGDDNDKLELQFLILDQYGNYIPGLSEKQAQINIENFCRHETSQIKLSVLNEQEFTSSDDGLNIGISVEKSAAAKNLPQLIKNLKEFSSKLDQSDAMMFSTFNQNIEQVTKLLPAENAHWRLKTYAHPEKSGLSALYKTAFKSIVQLGSSKKEGKNLYIMVVYGADNSSIIYDAQDVADIAKEFGIPIYIIGIGGAIESYSLKYLCSVTGGKYYYIQDYEISNINLILQEIIFSGKTHYSVEFPVDNFLGKCREINSKLSIPLDEKVLSDDTRIIIQPWAQYSGYQAVAAYTEGIDKVAEQFHDNIESLAEVLKDNPAYAVQLIGHSYEEKSETDQQLSLQRAQLVRRELITKGAAPHQIRVKAEGSNKPVYYIPREEWQLYYNRRVEIKWLDPELMPFEIIAEQTWTEEKALLKVEEWERKGKQAYYERYLHNHKPIYRVKLWGYKTYSEAKNSAKELSEKYRASFTVD